MFYLVLLVLFSVVALGLSVKMVMNELSLDINENKYEANAAEYAFKAANQTRFIGDHPINMYDTNNERFLASNLSSQFKTSHY